MCIGCVRTCWNPTYDEATNTTTFYDQKGNKRTFEGKEWPDQFFAHPELHREWAPEVLGDINARRVKIVANLQAEKKLDKYLKVQRCARQAEEKKRILMQKIVIGHGKYLTLRDTFFSLTVCAEEQHIVDADVFLDQGKAVLHGSMVPKEEWKKNEAGQYILLSSDNVTDDIVGLLGIGHKVGKGTCAWGTIDAHDVKTFLEGHHGYEFEDGTKQLLFIFTSINKMYGGWHQFRMENDRCSGIFIPEHCPRFCQIESSGFTPCAVFELTYHDSEMDNAEIECIYLNGEHVSITEEDDDTSRFFVTPEGIDHPLAPLTSTQPSQPEEEEDIVRANRSVSNAQGDENAVPSAVEQIEASDGIDVILVLSLGLVGVHQVNDPVFLNARNILVPKKSKLLDECERRGVLPQSRGERTVDNLIKILSNPNTISRHTHDKASVAYLKQKMALLRDEAEQIIATDVTPYQGMHKADRSTFRCILSKGGIRKPATETCFEGRLNGHVIFRYEGMEKSKAPLRAMNFSVDQSKFKPGATWKGVNLANVPRTADMELGFFRDAAGASDWVSEHQATETCFEGRLNGHVIFRYEGSGKALSALRKQLVPVTTRTFKAGAHWQDLNLHANVPRTADMELGFFHDAHGASDWLSTHQQPQRETKRISTIASSTSTTITTRSNAPTSTGKSVSVDYILNCLAHSRNETIMHEGEIAAFTKYLIASRKEMADLQAVISKQNEIIEDKESALEELSSQFNLLYLESSRTIRSLEQQVDTLEETAAESEYRAEVAEETVGVLETRVHIAEESAIELRAHLEASENTVVELRSRAQAEEELNVDDAVENDASAANVQNHRRTNRSVYRYSLKEPSVSSKLRQGDNMFPAR